MAVTPGYLPSDPEEGGEERQPSQEARELHRAGTAGGHPFRWMECEPGAEAQVDFGRGAPVVPGKRKSTWVFRIVLSHSRKGYSEAVYRQFTNG
jgi:hypothetical protein